MDNFNIQCSTKYYTKSCRLSLPSNRLSFDYIADQGYDGLGWAKSRKSTNTVLVSFVMHYDVIYYIGIDYSVRQYSYIEICRK